MNESPLPCSGDLHRQLRGASAFSSLDLQQSGHHQITVKDGVSRLH